MQIENPHEIIEAYTTQRGILPMIDVGAYMLNIERFLMPKPDFIDGIEYRCFFQPSDAQFSSFIIVDSLMHQPMTAANRLARIVAEHYGLEFIRPIVRNSSPKFFNIGSLANMNEAGVDDGSETMQDFRRVYGDKGISSVYPGEAASQALAARSEELMGEEFVRAMRGATFQDELSAAVDKGFDFIFFYNPFREKNIAKNASTLSGLVMLLKKNGVLVLEYSRSMYNARAIRELIAEKGITPIHTGSPLPLPFLTYLDSVDVYASPRRQVS